MRIYFMMFACLLCIATTAQGIAFREGKDWSAVLNEAKVKNRFILVDCSATWCKPCKVMEQTVFVQDTVGAYVNAGFISFRLQMDTTAVDPVHVRKDYATARRFISDYGVSTFPTFLVFSPQGVVLHKETGKKSTADFLAFCADARDASKQYFTQLRGFQKGTLPLTALPSLAEKAQALGDKEIAFSVARKFMKMRLEKLPLAEFVTKQHLHFMLSFIEMISPSDRIFKVGYEQPRLVDSVFGVKNVAAELVGQVLRKKIIQPYIASSSKRGAEPNWNLLTKKLSIPYNNETVRYVMAESKYGWYNSKRDSSNAARYLVESMSFRDMSGLPSDIGTLFNLNNSAYFVFRSSVTRSELQSALLWCDSALMIAKKVAPEIIPAVLDTKANILYKMGDTAAAIGIQEQAVSLQPDLAEFKTTLEKMKKGQRTW